MQTIEKNNFEKAYDEAFTLASKMLLKKDIVECCADSGAMITLQSYNTLRIKIDFLNRIININLPSVLFTAEDSAAISIWEKILILHYLCNANGSPQKNSLINFKQIKEGLLYYPSFERRCIKPFMRLFTKDQALAYRNALRIGGEKVDFGDFALKFNPFPRVSLIYMVWNGDNEIPADGNILFDSSIKEYLSAEDIVVLCQYIIFQLK